MLGKWSSLRGRLVLYISLHKYIMSVSISAFTHTYEGIMIATRQMSDLAIDHLQFLMVPADTQAYYERCLLLLA